MWLLLWSAAVLPPTIAAALRPPGHVGGGRTEGTAQRALPSPAVQSQRLGCLSCVSHPRAVKGKSKGTKHEAQAGPEAYTHSQGATAVCDDVTALQGMLLAPPASFHSSAREPDEKDTRVRDHLSRTTLKGLLCSPLGRLRRWPHSLCARGVQT